MLVNQSVLTAIVYNFATLFIVLGVYHVKLFALLHNLRFTSVNTVMVTPPYSVMFARSLSCIKQKTIFQEASSPNISLSIFFIIK